MSSIFSSMKRVYPVNKLSASDCVGERASLRRGKEIKAKGVGKGSWQTVERDDQTRRIRWTRVPSQPLLPGQTPMGALGPRADPFTR